MTNTTTETKFKKVTSRMVEAGRIERRRFRVAARRAGIYGSGHVSCAVASADWRRACGRAYRLRDNLPESALIGRVR
jgi:hypothetical protein